MNALPLANDLSNGTVTRIIVYSVTALLIGYDCSCAVFGWPEITTIVRSVDEASGGLVRWGMLALWCHFFLTNWKLFSGV